MRNFGTPIILDLQARGSASVTPGAAVQEITFQPTRLDQIVGRDAWPTVAGIGNAVRIGIDQPAAGASVINQDELFRCIDGHNVFAPLLGTTHDREVYTGPVAKHVIEFTSLGYMYCDRARAQIPTADGDTAVELYTFLPFTHDSYQEANGFQPWVGWLRDLEYRCRIAVSTAIASVSTGAASEAPCSARAWLEMFPKNRPALPVLNYWRRYTQAASAGVKTFQLLNVGDGGPASTLPGCRLSSIVELLNKLAFGGTSTGDIYTGFSCPDLGQNETANVDAILLSYKRQMGHRGPISGNGASNAALHDGAGNPYLMSAAPNLLLNDVDLAYFPWRFPAGDFSQISTTKKWGVAHLTLTRQFSTVPSSGSYVAITNEIKQLRPDAAQQLLAQMNLPAAVSAQALAAYNNSAFGEPALIRTA